MVKGGGRELGAASVDCGGTEFVAVSSTTTPAVLSPPLPRREELAHLYPLLLSGGERLIRSYHVVHFCRPVVGVIIVSKDPRRGSVEATKR